MVLLDHRHRDRDGQVGLNHPTRAKQQQVLGLQQPGVAAGEHLQLLPVLGLVVLVVKAVQAFLPRQMGIVQQPLAPCDLAVVDLLLTEGIEELGGATALGLRLLGERLPVAAEASEFQLFEQQRQRRFHRRWARLWGGGGHRRPADVGESRGQTGRCGVAAPGSAAATPTERGFVCFGPAAERRAPAQRTPPARRRTTPQPSIGQRRHGHRRPEAVAISPTSVRSGRGGDVTPFIGPVLMRAGGYAAAG